MENRIKMFYVYMLRCEDNSLYTGFTTDIKRRFKEHIAKNKPYGKYTRAHTASCIEAAWSCENKKEACRLEYYIKRLKKEQKELLIKEPHKLHELFCGKLDCSAFLPVDCDN